MRESSISVKSVEKSSLNRGPWELTKELPMRVCSSVVTIVHTKQREKVSFWRMKHLFTWKEMRSNVISVTKDFLRKTIWKFICRFIPGKSHMCAPSAQRDLGKIGKRRAMKRHTTTCAILPTNKLLSKCLNVKYVAKRSGAVEVWRDIWKTTKNERKYKCSFCPSRFNTNCDMRRHERKQHKHESISPLEKLEVPANITQLKRFFGDKDMETQTDNFAKQPKQPLNVEMKSLSCNQCNYTARFSSNLKRHMLVHSSEKPFECTQCTYSANQAAHLKKHKLSIHPPIQSDWDVP